MHSVLRLQQTIGNRATGALLDRLAVQRKQFSEGSKQAPFQPTVSAKSQANWVIGKRLHNQAIAAGTTIGKYTWNQVAGTALGTLGYEKFKGKTYCGGRTYGNNDDQLPGGTTYSEWDVAEYAPGARGTERVVIATKGTAYFTNNHYADFVEIRSM
jgi:guanyl-specific ribonuclease Sa